MVKVAVILSGVSGSGIASDKMRCPGIFYMYLILFDFDGTLVDSQHGIVESMEMAFSSQNLAKPRRQAILSVVGLSLEQAVWHLHREADLKLVKCLCDSYKQAFSEIRNRATHEEPLYGGARETLDKLSGKPDVLLGIATGKSRKGLLRVLEEQGLLDYFQTLQTADDARSKPHPEMIDRALGETGVEKNNTVMIGDTSFDMEMGRTARVTPIGVTWGYHSMENLEKAGAQHIVHNFSELFSVLTGFCENRDAVL